MSTAKGSSTTPGDLDKKRRWPRWLLEIAILLGVIVGIRFYQHWDLPTGPAPALAGTLLNGAQYDRSRLPRGPLLVHFWATWCGICRLEQDSIQAIAQDYPLITVAMQSGIDEGVRQYLTENGLDFPVINDPDGEISRRWGIQGVPSSFILDADGKIRFVEVGYTTGLGLRARLWWVAGNGSG